MKKLICFVIGHDWLSWKTNSDYLPNRRCYRCNHRIYMFDVMEKYLMNVITKGRL